MATTVQTNKNIQLSFLTTDENGKESTTKVTLPNLKVDANLDDVAAVVDSYAELKEGSLSKAAIIDESLLVK
ncbi:hypothetical protein CM240_0216 [Clostridium bornimense]|uniref:DUF1659 domain-containing protein n=1 Tax=Clostridium bornimense TaxID=1216932 RepID=W6RS53_9CLOT|nr:DUF1659 domain-containing protein [Clostridium bornimense]CDM67386.1 hypothetical protein CM240_0216 [Clostridium bornimense]